MAATTALIDCARIFAAIELSKKNWLLAIYRPSLDRTSQYRVEHGDAARLLELLGRARQEEQQALGQPIGVSCCYEASYDGFWLHRQLEAAGIENFVIDPASLLVNRRAKRAKTDRIDVRGLLRSLIAWLRGDKEVCRMAHPLKKMHAVLTASVSACSRSGSVMSIGSRDCSRPKASMATSRCTAIVARPSPS